MNDYSNFHDDFIDVRYVEDFLLWVLVTCNGDTETISVDDNFYHPTELIYAYKRLANQCEWWAEDIRIEEREEYLAFKQWVKSEFLEPEECEMLDEEDKEVFKEGATPSE